MSGLHIDKYKIKLDFYKKLHIQAFELAAAVNTIPVITLNVLPIENTKSSGNGKYVTASAPNIGDITDLYKELLSDAIKLDKEATIEIELLPQGEKGSVSGAETNQKIKLEKWIMTDVGMSSISTEQAPILTVTFCHPVVKLDRSGTIYEEIMNPLGLTKIYRTNGGSEPISYMDNLYETFSSDSKVNFFKVANDTEGGASGSYQTKVKSIRSKLKDNKPGKYIEGKTQRLFMSEIVPSLEGNIRVATGYLAAPSAFCDTTWRRLVSDICPNFLTHVIPTYTEEKLKLEPTNPWQEASLTLDLSVVTTLDVISMDPNPIIGAALVKGASTGYVVSNNNRKNKGSLVSSTYSFYFPDKALKSEAMGDVLNLGEAKIVSYIMSMSKYSNSTSGHSAPKGKDMQTAGNDVTDQNRVKMDEAYLQAMFLLNYRKNCKASLTAIPIFYDSSHNLLLPGRVLTFYDPVTSSRLMCGFVTRVIVKASTDGGGMTIIEMSHTRPADGGDDIYVEEGTTNPCYPKPQV